MFISRSIVHLLEVVVIVVEGAVVIARREQLEPTRRQ
jgi:hypothetical protein